MSRALGRSLLACAAAAALWAAAARAQEALAPRDILANARARYTKARDVRAAYEGTAVFHGLAVTVRGSVAFRAGYASRHEIRFEGGRGQLVLREGSRIRHWRIDGERHLPVRDHLLSEEEGKRQPLDVPLLPAFNTAYDESTISLVEVRRQKARPPVYVIQAKLSKPGDPFAAARLGIEDGTWIVRTLDLLDAGGEPAMSLRFTEVEIDRGLPLGSFDPPPELVK